MFHFGRKKKTPKVPKTKTNYELIHDTYDFKTNMQPKKKRQKHLYPVPVSAVKYSRF